jgi:hypothetical protein
MDRSYAFISYSRKDAAFAKSLSSSLTEVGISNWFDENEMLPGDSLVERLQIAIEKANHFIIILSQESVQSKWVQIELAAAIHLEIETRVKRIIPVVIDECKIPLFVRDYIYADFKNPETYGFGLSKLVQAIDRANNIENTVVDNYKDNFFFDNLASIEAKFNDPWAAAIKDMMLTRLWDEAMRLNAYEGAFRVEFSLGLVMGSNIDSQDFYSYTSFVGFIQQIERNNLLNHDLLKLLVELTENENIAVEYREAIIPTLHSRYTKSLPRNIKLSLLPKIFHTKKQNRLTNHIIIKTFNKNDESSLDLLWEMGDAYYRAQILDYMNRFWGFSLDSRSIEHNSLEHNLSFIKKKDGTDIKLVIPELDLLKLSWSYVGNNFYLYEMLEQIQLLSELIRTEKTGYTEIIELLSDKNVKIAINNYGQKAIFNWLAEIVTSPFVDGLIGLWAMDNILVQFDSEILSYRKEFPGCLLQKKDNGRHGTFSILGSLIRTIDKTGLSLHKLLNLIQLFPQKPFWFAIYKEIKDSNVDHPALESMIAYFNGDISIKSLRNVIMSSINN